jgi:hypothetical protein
MCLQTWVRYHDYECAVVHDFHDAETLAEYETGIQTLPTARPASPACAWVAAVNETAAEFVCAASLPVVRHSLRLLPMEMTTEVGAMFMRHAE